MEAYFSLIVAALTGAVAYIFLRKRAAPKVDPVAEADAYVVYGRTAQAIAVLESALKANPNQPKVAAKLAELLNRNG